MKNYYNIEKNHKIYIRNSKLKFKKMSSMSEYAEILHENINIKKNEYFFI